MACVLQISASASRIDIGNDIFLPPKSPPNQTMRLNLSLTLPGLASLAIASAFPRPHFPAAHDQSKFFLSEAEQVLRSSALYADTNTCRGQELVTVKSSILGAVALARAGRAALAAVNADGNPTRYFFGLDPLPPMIDSLLVALIGPWHPVRIRITCVDELDFCGSSFDTPTWPPANQATGVTPGVSTAAYVCPNKAPGTIILCPVFFEHSRPINPPCTNGLARSDFAAGMGSHSLPVILVHEFTHAITQGQIVDNAYGSVPCHNLLVGSYDAISDGLTPLEAVRRGQALVQRNADSYARWLGWAFDQGWDPLGYRNEARRRCTTFVPEANLSWIAGEPDLAESERTSTARTEAKAL